MHKQLKLYLGPCVIEDYDTLATIAGVVSDCQQQLSVDVVFKASIDKANRTSINSYRGVGIDEGLRMLEDIHKSFGLKTITDIHETGMVKAVASVVDEIQIPAFLCRQTDLIFTAAQTGKPLLLKKGQFMAPEDMQYVAEKALSSGAKNISLCERGTTFGYKNLVVDYRGIVVMKKFGHPVIMDATHAVQLPAAEGNQSGAKRSYVPMLAKAALVSGADGIFMETHPNPKQAKSDGPNAVPLSFLKDLIKELVNLKNYLDSVSDTVVLEDN